MASPAARAAGPDSSEPLRVGDGDEADVGEAVLERRVEEQFPPGAGRVCAECGENLARRLDYPGIERELASADADRVEEEAVTAERRVEAPCALGQRRERHVAGCEADTGAHRRDVVEVVPGALELEQDRAGAGQFGCGVEAERLLAGVGVGDAVGNGACGARTRDQRHALLERRARGGLLEPAVLVEEPGVEMQNPVAHDVEAEVSRLDHARVDRPHRYLVGVPSADRHGPAAEVGVVIDEWPDRIVAGEANAMEIVRLALIPARGSRQVDDRGYLAVRDRDGLKRYRAVCRDE